MIHEKHLSRSLEKLYSIFENEKKEFGKISCIDGLSIPFI